MLRLDGDVAISEAVYDGVVLRHYGFAGHWFKVHVSTGLSGRLTETGDHGRRFAVNCDIAAPMEREGTARSASTCLPMSWSGGCDVICHRRPGRVR